MAERLPVRPHTVSLGRRLVIPLNTPWLVMALVASKPLVDALAERSREVALDPGTLWAGLMLAVGVYWVFKQRSFNWAQSLLIIVILGLGLGSVVSAMASRDHMSQILVEGVRLVAGLAPAAVLLGVKTKSNAPRLRGLLRLFALGVMVHSVAAVLQYFGYLPATYFQVGQPRPSGLYFHPVSLGILINVSLLLVVLANCRRWIRLPKALLLSAALLVMGVVSTHRASLIVAAIVMLGWLAMRLTVEGRRYRINIRWMLGLGVGMALLALLLYALPQSRPLMASALESVVGVIDIDDLDPTADSFLRGRGQRWAGAIGVIGNGTWAQRLIGHGWQVVDPHSDYIRSVLVHGYAGSLLLAFGLGAILLGFATRADRLGRLYITLIAICTLAYALTTKPTTYTFYMWAVTALAWVATGRTRLRVGHVERAE